MDPTVSNRQPRLLSCNNSRLPRRQRQCSCVASAVTRSALLLRLAAGPEQKLERGPRRSLAWPVVYVVEVDRLGRRFHALVTGGAGRVGQIAAGPPCRLQSVSSRRVRWAFGEARAARSTAEPLEPSALQPQLDTTVRD